MLKDCSPTCETQPPMTWPTARRVDAGALDRGALHGAEQVGRMQARKPALAAPDRAAHRFDDHHFTHWLCFPARFCYMRLRCSLSESTGERKQVGGRYRSRRGGCGTLTIASYNVHRCIGRDGRTTRRASRRSSRSSRPTSSRCRRSTSATTSASGVDQLRFLAEATGCESVWGPVLYGAPRPVRQRPADPPRGARGARHRPQRAAPPAPRRARRRPRGARQRCASSPPTSASVSTSAQIQVRRLLRRARRATTSRR